MAKPKNPHTVLLKALNKALDERKDCYGWINNSGAIRVRGHFYRYGLKGSADWIGLTSSGKFLSFEVKTGEAKQTKEQKLFQMNITGKGGYYFLIRSVEDAMEKLDKISGHIRLG